MLKILAALVLLIALLWLSTPSRIVAVPPFDRNLSSLQLASDNEHNVIPGTEKRILWFDAERKTEWSVVVLHGFSATRQETAPLAENIASSLSANLFETRLKGHGLSSDALVDVTAEDWLVDAAEALKIGSDIGEKVIVIGVSTGATLATAMLDHPLMDSVDTLVMISPNFRPRDKQSLWLTRPLGPLLARMMIGVSYSWEPHNEAQELFWTTVYPTNSIVEMMRLVNFANTKISTATSQRWLVIYSPQDQVVSTAAIHEAYAQIMAPKKQIVEVVDAADPSHHVLAGNILSPNKTLSIAQTIVGFVTGKSSL